jgi:hypothetical protein
VQQVQQFIRSGRHLVLVSQELDHVIRPLAQFLEVKVCWLTDWNLGMIGDRPAARSCHSKNLSVPNSEGRSADPDQLKTCLVPTVGVGPGLRFSPLPARSDPSTPPS